MPYRMNEIVRLIKDGACDSMSIRKASGLSRNRVSNALRRLAELGRIKCTQKGSRGMGRPSKWEVIERHK